MPSKRVSEDARFERIENRKRDRLLRAFHTPDSPGFSKSVLELASETPDNRNAVRHVKVSRVTDGTSAKRTVLGLAVKGHALSEIVCALEDLGPSPALKRQFPRLSRGEWDAVFRVLSLIVLATTRYPSSKRHRQGRKP